MFAKDWLKNCAESLPWQNEDQRKAAKYVCGMIADCVDPEIRIYSGRGTLVERAISQVVIEDAETKKMDHVAILTIVGAINSFT